MKFEQHINELISWSESLGTLSAEEEIACAKDKSEDNLCKLVNHNIRLILHFGKNIFNDPLTDDNEVFSAGIDALFHSAQKYDGSNRFSTYAAAWLRNYMHQAGYGRRKEKGVRFTDLSFFENQDNEETGNGMDAISDEDDYAEQEHQEKIKDQLEHYKKQIISECGFDSWRAWELRIGYDHSYRRIAEYIGLPEPKIRQMIEAVGAYIKPLAYTNSLFGGLV